MRARGFWAPTRVATWARWCFSTTPQQHIAPESAENWDITSPEYSRVSIGTECLCQEFICPWQLFERQVDPFLVRCLPSSDLFYFLGAFVLAVFKIFNATVFEN